jgi:hypothetical protein
VDTGGALLASGIAVAVLFLAIVWVLLAPEADWLARRSKTGRPDRIAPPTGGGSTARRSWPWLEPGPIGSRNGSQDLFDKFDLFRLAGAPLRNRTVDLLLTMHASFV